MAKILMVEDDATLAQMYQKKLTHEGFEVTLAFSGEEGLQIVEQENPDLILLDIMMPGMDGFEVIKKIKEIKSLASTPIIILTNLGSSDVFIDHAKKMGIKNYLIKYKTSASTVVEKIREELGE